MLWYVRELGSKYKQIKKCEKKYIVLLIDVTLHPTVNNDDWNGLLIVGAFYIYIGVGVGGDWRLATRLEAEFPSGASDLARSVVVYTFTDKLFDYVLGWTHSIINWECTRVKWFVFIIAQRHWVEWRPTASI